MTGRMPFWDSLGAGAPANDPSPRKRGPSSVLVNCAASRIVNGRTRTVTDMLEDPSVVIAAVLTTIEAERSYVAWR